MYCSQCGNQIKQNQIFCGQCGQKVKLPNQDNMQSAQNKNTEVHNYKVHNTDIQNSKPGCLKKLIMLAAIAMGLFVLILIVMPSSGDVQTFNADLSEQDQNFITTNGVAVKISPYVLDEDAQLKIQEKNRKLFGDVNVLKTINVELGDLHNLDDFIEIAIPFDRSMITTGKAEDVLEVYSKNPKTGKMEVELTDIRGDQIIVYTDHLSDFELREVQLGEKIRRSNIGELTSEDCLGFLNKVNQGADIKDSMIELGFDSISNGVGWAGNFATFTGALYETPMLKNSVYGNLGLLGNTVFYVTVAKDIYGAVDTGNYTPLINTLKTSGVSYLVSFANPAAQVAYTASQIVLYVGDELNKAVHEEADAKYVYAFEEVFEERVTGPYKQKYGDTWKSVWYKEWYKKLENAAKATNDAKEFQLEVERLVEEVVNIPLSDEWSMDFDAYVADYYSKKQDEDRGLIGNITKKIESSQSQYDKTKLIKQKQLELINTLRPVLLHVSKKLMTKAEQGYYKAFTRMQNDLNKPYKLTLELDGELPKGATGLFELVKEGETVFEIECPSSGKYEMDISFIKYFELKKPDIARLVVINNKVEKQEIAYAFKLEDQLIKFTIESVPEETSTDNNPDEKNNTDEDNTDEDNTDVQNNDIIIDQNEIKNIKKSDAYKYNLEYLNQLINSMEESWKGKGLVEFKNNTFEKYNKDLDILIDMKKMDLELFINKEDKDDYDNYRIKKSQLYIDIVEQYRKDGINNEQYKAIQKQFQNIINPNGGHAVAFSDEFMPLQEIHRAHAVISFMDKLMRYAVDNAEFGISEAMYQERIDDYNKRLNQTYELIPFGGAIYGMNEEEIYVALRSIGILFE